MVQLVRGNLLDLQHGIICHGVNRQRVMGSGVALAILKRYPLVRETYMNTHPMPDLGQSHGIEVCDNLWIVNCYTQEFYGRDSNVVYASIDAIRESITRVASIAISNLGLSTIHMPFIGCGLGGLNYDADVKLVLEDIESDTGINIIINYI